MVTMLSMLGVLIFQLAVALIIMAYLRFLTDRSDIAHIISMGWAAATGAAGVILVFSTGRGTTDVNATLTLEIFIITLSTAMVTGYLFRAITRRT